MGFMKTEQEQIEKMARIMCGYCSTDGKCAVSKNGREPDVCANVDTEHCLYKEYAERLFEKGCYGNVSEYKAEIERLKAENEKLLDSIESVQAGRCRLRCPLTEQAVKEFAERLKKYSYTDNCFKDGKWHRYVLVSDIDELIGGKEK